MSQAELHFIRARLQGGKMNKAKKGELRSPLPIGLCYNEEGHIILIVMNKCATLFSCYLKYLKREAAAYAVVKYFR